MERTNDFWVTGPFSCYFLRWDVLSCQVDIVTDLWGHRKQNSSTINKVYSPRVQQSLQHTTYSITCIWCYWEWMYTRRIKKTLLRDCSWLEMFTLQLTDCFLKLGEKTHLQYNSAYWITQYFSRIIPVLFPIISLMRTGGKILNASGEKSRAADVRGWQTLNLCAEKYKCSTNAKFDFEWMWIRWYTL